MSNILDEETLYKKSPQELTKILYQALLDRLYQATDAIKQRKFDQANENLQKCNDLLHRLGAGINYEAGIIADQLESLYQYLAERSIQANVKKDILIVEEMISIVTEISNAWNHAVETLASTPLSIQRSKASAYEQLHDLSSIDIKD